MNRNAIIVGVVCLVLGAGGFWLYQNQTRSGVELSVGGSSVRIETR